MIRLIYNPHPIKNLRIPKKVNTVAVYRLYNAASGEHLYTTQMAELRGLCLGDLFFEPAGGWNLEGIAWNAPKTGTPVYRLYQPGLDTHLYTSDENEIRILTTEKGWQMDFDGTPVFYSGGNTPIYRLYNGEQAGLHHFTTAINEYQVLPEYGWKQEQVAFYGDEIGIVNADAGSIIRTAYDAIYRKEWRRGNPPITKPSFHRLVTYLVSQGIPEETAEEVLNDMDIDWIHDAMCQYNTLPCGDMVRAYYYQMYGFTNEQIIEYMGR